MMSSSSSSSTTPQEKYDVFVSFRGSDTRLNFTSHLYAALCQKKIKAFIDHQLKKGDEISPSLLKVIQESKVLIIVFSECYGSSRWCLEELVQIIECKKIHGKGVIPVFYHVNPTDVRHQTGIFAKSFAQHGKYKNRSDKLQRWKTALKEASDLVGFSSDEMRLESELIEKIVEDVLKRLNSMSESDYKGLIGIKSKIEKIESLLCIGSNNVCTVGIWGLGGIGKTTIASAVYSKIFNQFEASYFVQNVRERSEKGDGLIGMQQELLSTILQDKNLTIGSQPIQLTSVKDRLSCMKVLIIFDDVTYSSQIEFLVGGLDLFGSGSRFLLTTRDRQVLRNCDVDNIYEVEKLSDNEAILLFNHYAFKKCDPKAEFIQLSHKVLTKAKGVPLALRVLGSFLCGRSEEEWHSALNKLKRIPHGDIQKVLKISYDELDPVVKNILLDIACFLNLMFKDDVISFLDACGFFADIGLSVLVDKSLITIEDNIIKMHDLVQEMGREVVQQESKYLSKRSRLWDHEDIQDILVANLGSKAIEGISLDISKIRATHLNLRAFSKMHNLRFFSFYISFQNPHEYEYMYEHEMQNIFEEFDLASNRLSYFYWMGCPLKSMPLNSHLKYLVQLAMPQSKTQELWNDVQDLFNLKHVDLRYSKFLIRCPDLSRATKLERLILNGCANLVEIPTSTPLVSLRTLILSDCKKLKTLPQISLSFNMEELVLNGSGIEELPSSIGNLSKLVLLNLDNCERLRNLPRSICKLKSLNELSFPACAPWNIWPDIKLESSDRLYFFEVMETAMKEFLSSIINGLCNLTRLNLYDCGIMELPDSLGRLSSLQELYLGRNRFVSIPTTIKDISQLQLLDLRDCKKLRVLPELPRNLRDINTGCCTSLELVSGLPSLFTTTSRNYKFDFSYCVELDEKALREMIKDVILEIQLKGAEWFEEINNYEYRPRAHICVPGSEIPEWFNFQRNKTLKGNPLSFKLPPNGTRSFVCVVCIALVIHSRWSLATYSSCVGKINGKRVHVVDIPCKSIDHVIYDFFLLSYKDCLDVYRDNCSNEISFEFNIVHTLIKKFGVHLVYDQDFGEAMKQLNSRFDHVGSFFKN